MSVASRASRAQAQLHARIVGGFQRHRKEMETEQCTLTSQANCLTEGVKIMSLSG